MLRFAVNIAHIKFQSFTSLNVFLSHQICSMENTIQQYPQQPQSATVFNGFIAPLIPTVLVVLFLFYIDEGWYSFRWMLNWGNWIVFVIYLVMIFPAFWLLSRFIFNSFHGITKVFLIALLGIPLMLILLFGLLF